MAEGIANKWLKEHHKTGWLAVSAGVFATQGVPTSSGTVEALSQRNIFFDGISKPLTKKMAEGATTVLCMSASHLEVAEQLTSRAELLDSSGDIIDPIGQDQAAYDTLADYLELLIANKLTLLTHEGA